MAVSKRLRYEILRRDNFQCRYCGKASTDGQGLTIDHVTPTALGGSDQPANLVTACADCNAGKSSSNADMPLVDDVAQDALRWAAAIKRATDIERAQQASRQLTHEDIWTYWTQYNNQWAWPTAGWEATVDRFLTAGLSLTDMLEAIDITRTAHGVTQRNRWRYFCGVCWKIVERRQEAARAILAAEENPDGS